MALTREGACRLHAFFIKTHPPYLGAKVAGDHAVCVCGRNLAADQAVDVEEILCGDAVLLTQRDELGAQLNLRSNEEAGAKGKGGACGLIEYLRGQMPYS